MKTHTEIYTAYGALYQAINAKYRKLICQADPRLDYETAFHLAHNWGNEQSRALLDRYYWCTNRLLKRQDREWNRAFKAQHSNSKWRGVSKCGCK